MGLVDEGSEEVVCSWFCPVSGHYSEPTTGALGGPHSADGWSGRFSSKALGRGLVPTAEPWEQVLLLGRPASAE